MKKVSFNDIESRYSELSQLNNSKKSDVYLVQNMLDRRIYIKKELKNYNIDVYRQIIKINNMFIARVYELFQCDDMLVVIEEFINGQTLQYIIDNEGPLSEKKAIKYIVNLCSALETLHNQNPPIIHRDIKPSNVILDNNEIVKLIDFDVSRVYNDEKNVDTHILGTKGYASPEQFGFEQTDCRSDIYSIGVMLNVLTTGKHIKEKLNEGRLKEIIEKCTNIAPDKRYPSVKELKSDLENILKQGKEKLNVKEANKNVFLDLTKKDNILDLTKKESISDNKRFNNSEIEAEKIKENVNTTIKDENIKVNNLNKEALENDKYKVNDFKNKKEEGKIKKIFSIIKDIPGYRTKNIMKMIGATLWYTFLIFGFTISFGTGNVKEILSDIFTASFLLLMTLFNFNFKNIKNRLPVIRSSKKENKVVGNIVYNIIIFIGYGILLEIFKI